MQFECSLLFCLYFDFYRFPVVGEHWEAWPSIYICSKLPPLTGLLTGIPDGEVNFLILAPNCLRRSEVVGVSMRQSLTATVRQLCPLMLPLTGPLAGGHLPSKIMIDGRKVCEGYPLSCPELQNAGLHHMFFHY